MAESAKHAKIRCRSIIEVLGKPKEHIEKTIRDYVEQIKKDTDFAMLNEEYSDTQSHDDGHFSIFVEIEFLSKGLHPLIGFCFNYMPSSVEIIKPEELEMPNDMMNALFNDLQARLHKVDMVVKQKTNENSFLRANLKNALRNTIVISTSLAALNKEALSKATGIGIDELSRFTDDLIKEGKLSYENGLYQSKR